MSKYFQNLSITNGVRAGLCMLPMVMAAIFGLSAFVVPLGQGGFFNSTLPLAPNKFSRLIFSGLMVVPGLGFYLLGGNTIAYGWVAVLFALMVGFACGLLTGFRYLGMVAVSGFIPIYTAGLNAGSAERASQQFLAFALVCVYCGLVGLLPYWKSRTSPVAHSIDEPDRVIMAVKLGIGMAVSLGVSLWFSFGKLGWAPSAVGSVIRTDIDQSKRSAWIRAIAVIIGAIIATVLLGVLQSLSLVVAAAFILAVINGLAIFTPLGRLPLLYNAVILLLYSQTSTTSANELIDTRIVYNLVGILIALAIVYYPLPLISVHIKQYYQNLKQQLSVG